MALRVGIKIRDIRRSIGMSQKELAEKANINASHLSRIETEHFFPEKETLERIAEALDCSIHIHFERKS